LDQALSNTDPHFSPSPADLETLTKDVHEDINGRRPRTLPNDIRKKLVGKIAEEAVAALLRKLSPPHTVIDANRELAMNYPGYDFLVDDRLRIQVKGSPWVELIGWQRQECVDYYVIPNAIVREWVRAPRYLNKGRIELYWNRREFGGSTKQNLGQTREILNYRDRFELITALL
jgi:hypothetical protein